MSTVIVNDAILSTSGSVISFDGINNLSDNINNSNDHEMKSIEAEIHNILENQEKNADTSKPDTFRNLFINLQNHIDALAEEVKFLREDSISKSRTISNLIDIAGIRYKKCKRNNYSTNSVDSSCDDVKSIMLTCRRIIIMHMLKDRM